MAKQLVASMSGKWEPEKYKDDYKEALMEVIEEKVAAGGKEIAKPKKLDLRFAGHGVPRGCSSRIPGESEILRLTPLLPPLRLLIGELGL